MKAAFTTASADPRFARQESVFPSAQRESTVLFLYGAAANPVLGRALVAGAASLGIARLGSDYSAFPGPAHFFAGSFARLVSTINPDVDYLALDPEVPAVDTPRLKDLLNPWIVVCLHDVASAQFILADLTARTVRAPVLVAAAAPGGVLVAGFGDPCRAYAAVARIRFDAVAAGPPELGLLGAGLVLTRIILGGAPQSRRGLVGFYSTARPRRVTLAPGEEENLAGLLREIADAPAAPASFAGRKIAVVGAGALGNWATLPLALDGASLSIYDGDVAESHNLSRQFMLVHGLGQPKTATLAKELSVLAPRGTYTPITRFIRSPGDFEDLASHQACLSLPDRDAVRGLCSDAAREAGILFATAGSSTLGAQAVVSPPDRACYRCVTGAGTPDAGSHSCALAANSVVSTNMVGAGLVVHLLRSVLGGERPVNIRFVGDSRDGGNPLVKMATHVACSHLPSGPEPKQGERL